MPLTQDQADQLYLDQRALEIKATQENRIVNLIQGVVAVIALFLLIKRIIKK